MSTKLYLNNSSYIRNNNYALTSSAEKPNQELENKVESAKYRQIYKPANTTGKFVYSKREICVYMKNRALEKKQSDSKCAKTMDKIIDRAERNIQKIDKGETVRLPTYYHGRRSLNVVKSVLGECIRSQEANNGKGVYLSSEMEPDFGPFFFALDRDDVESQKIAESAVNTRELWVGSFSGKAVWRALKNDFTVKDKDTIKIAYLVAQEEKNLSEVEEMKKTVGPFETVSYEEAEEEKKMIRELQGYYEPVSWNPTVDKGIDQLSEAYDKVKPTVRVNPEMDFTQKWED